MVKIDRHISDLLYDHDCVIVPDMGGFISSYTPAAIHAFQQTIEPPSKKIAFNVFLTHNDGLLANHIAQFEELNYKEAVKEIKVYVDQYHREVDAGKKFSVEKVGVLYIDAERRVQFEPSKNVNYLKDSFGLSTVHYIQAAPLTSRKLSEEIRASVRQPKTIRIGKKRGSVANALLVAGSLLWFSMNVYFIAPGKIDFASLNPFHSSKPVTEIKINPAPAPAVNEEKPIVSASTKARVDTVYVKTTTPIVLEESPIQTPPTIESNKKTDHSFYLIAGAFRSLDNATKLVSDLKAAGFPNATMIDPNRELKKVSYNSFASIEEAHAGLNHLKEQKKEGWIFRR